MRTGRLREERFGGTGGKNFARGGGVDTAVKHDH